MKTPWKNWLFRKLPHHSKDDTNTIHWALCELKMGLEEGYVPCDWGDSEEEMEKIEWLIKKFEYDLSYWGYKCD